MWFESPKYIKPVHDVNLDFAKLVGTLDDEEAKISLAKFLYRNLGFSTELLTGIKLYPDQIITIKGLLTSNYSLCVWGRGVSKSIVSSSDSRVYDKKMGLISLPDLFPELDFSMDREADIPTRYFWNGKTWQATSKLFIQPKKDCLKIETKLGYKLLGAKTHIIKVWDAKTCTIIWKKYPEITENDYICISRDEILNFPEESKQILDDCYLIGLFLGDGYIPDSRKAAVVTTADKEISDFCLQRGAHIYPKKNTKAWDLNFSLPLINSFLDFYGVKRGLSYDKKIPQSVLLNQGRLKSCLQGLFDTDGSVASQRLTIAFSSTSKEMATQVHTALLTFGIISNLSERKTPSPFGKTWVITITGYNCKLFAERIGFRLSRKQNQLLEHLENHAFNSNNDIIPGIKEYCQREIKAKLRLPKVLSDEWRNKIRRKKNQYHLTYETLDSYIEFFERAGATEEMLKPLKEIKNENFFLDKVESIEDVGPRDCLDFNIPDGEMYWSNGFISHNTWTAAVFCMLQMLFEPNTTILIAGPTFRTARFIFNHIEKISEQPEAIMFAQALGAKVKRNDEFKWKINGGEIVAIPLNGEKIRGFRANVLLIDEFLLMSEELVERVLIPYLVASQDIKIKQQVRAKEDRLIKMGIMKESDRFVFPNRSKFIALSSASYTCEYLYKKYDEFAKQIYAAELPENGAKYFISQLAWDAIPIDRIDKSIIELAQSQESNNATFKREYCAQFIDGSDSYFSMKKMIECTIPDGEDPTLKLTGDKTKKYILAIDPNFSNSPTADDFAMCVVELDEDKKGGTVVHLYAVAGKDLKDHIKYFYYLCKNFDFEMIIIDYAGYQFIDAANESEWFKNDKIELKIFEFTSEKDGADYEEELKKARRNYNKQIGRIIFTQYFTSDFIRKGNEELQGAIDYKRIWFGGSIKGSAASFEKAINSHVDLQLVGEENISELIDTQEILLKQTKYQCASIEVKTTVKGVQSFDLPQIMKRDQTTTRMRRDSYTALMLAVWGMRCYKDITAATEEVEQSFAPFFV